MPNGKSITERQDIGDGYGGVISFFRSLKSLQGYVPLLEVQREIDNAIIADNDNTKYRYTIGDTVFIGASEYSITAIDDQRVMLSDTNAPFFNKEYDRAEFDQKIKENSLNEHLKVTSLPEESTEIINAKAEPEAEYEDAFLLTENKKALLGCTSTPIAMPAVSMLRIHSLLMKSEKRHKATSRQMTSSIISAVLQIKLFQM